LGDKIEESDPSKNFTIDLDNLDKAGVLKENAIITKKLLINFPNLRKRVENSLK
jgi:hypothetical protein